MSLFIEFHGIQNIAAGCLNRDDVGAPKTAQFGGSPRARISSQCLKRAQRKAFASMGLLSENELGVRTNRIHASVTDALAERGIECNPAAITEALGLIGLKVKQKKGREHPETDYLLFIPSTSLSGLIDLIAEHHDDLVDGKAPASVKKEVQSLIGANSVDVALFGRMIADDKALSTDAAVQTAHSLGVSRVARESDFFTAVDDLAAAEEADAGMLGNVEFNSSCHYRYASLNVDLLIKNLEGDRALAVKTIGAWIRASVMAIPTGKQNSFAAHNLPEFVAIGVHDTQPVSLANAYQRPISNALRNGGDGPSELAGGIVAGSVARLNAHADQMEKAYGLNLNMRAMDLTSTWNGSTVDSLDALIESVLTEVA